MKIHVAHDNSEAGAVLKIDFDQKSFEIRTSLPLEIGNYDFAVWPLLLYAMKHRRPIEMDLPVTEELLFNVNVLQSFLHRYMNLDPVPIHAAQQVQSGPVPSTRTILPFSGGVDSSFSLLYHHFELRRKIDAAMMVRGLDLWDEGEYQQACQRGDAILGLTGAAAVRVRTTVRNDFVTSLGWKLHSDFVLAGLLHVFDAGFGYGFISGEGDAGLLSVQQCFQSPFLNERLFFLFSNDAMLIQNFEGANFTKIQKIEFISRFPEIRRHLRVCWESRRHFNCGSCGKCVRTQLPFIAVTGAIPECFPKPADEAAVRKLLQSMKQGRPQDPDSPRVIVRKELLQVMETAERNHVRHPLLDLLKAAIDSEGR